MHSSAHTILTFYARTAQPEKGFAYANIHTYLQLHIMSASVWGWSTHTHTHPIHHCIVVSCGRRLSKTICPPNYVHKYTCPIRKYSSRMRSASWPEGGRAFQLRRAKLRARAVSIATVFGNRRRRRALSVPYFASTNTRANAGARI